MNLSILPGKPFPLGATVYKKGVNFALYSENATGVELCLFNADNSPGGTDQDDRENGPHLARIHRRA